MDKKIMENIGETLIAYEDILDSVNMSNLCYLKLDESKNKDLIDIFIIMINKYKKSNVLNLLLEYINILYNPDKRSINIQTKFKHICVLDIEKIIDEYGETIKRESLIIYLNTIIEYYKKMK
jgi:hypothetical protein